MWRKMNVQAAMIGISLNQAGTQVGTITTIMSARPHPASRSCKPRNKPRGRWVKLSRETKTIVGGGEGIDLIDLMIEGEMGRRVINGQMIKRMRLKGLRASRDSRMRDEREDTRIGTREGLMDSLGVVRRMIRMIGGIRGGIGNNRPEKFQTDRGRSSQNDGYQNDNGYQGRSNRRFDGQGKSGDTSRYNSNKNDNNTEKTYRLMERKKDNGPAQEENQSTKRSNGREATQQDGIGNWKGPGQEENAVVKNQVNIRPDFQMLSQQSQPFIPQQQQMVSDGGGRRVTDAGANQALNQGSVVRTKVMTNGPEMIPQSQSIPMLPFKVEDHCLSKYWEDGKVG